MRAKRVSVTLRLFSAAVLAAASAAPGVARSGEFSPAADIEEEEEALRDAAAELESRGGAPASVELARGLEAMEGQAAAAAAFDAEAASALFSRLFGQGASPQALVLASAGPVPASAGTVPPAGARPGEVPPMPPPDGAAAGPGDSPWGAWLSGAWRTALARGRQAAVAAGSAGYEALWGVWRASGLSEPYGLWRARAFLRARQRENGSWPSGWERIWDNTQMRVAVSAMTLEALGDADSPEARAARDRAYRFILQGVRQSQADLERDGETFPGNNLEPYALAYGLSALTERLGQLPRGRQRREARQAIRALLDRVATTSWRYTGPGSSATTFQLALLARGLQSAEAAGFRLPRRVSPDGAEGAGRRRENVLQAILTRLSGSRDAGSGGFPYTIGRPATAEDAAFRSPLIEHLLYQSGRSTRARLRAAAERFMSNRAEFERVILAPGAGNRHDAGHHNWAHYYYPYGMEGMSYVLEDLHGLGDPQARDWARQLVDTLLRRQAADGSWRYSEHFGDVTDTATFVVALERLARVAGR